MEAGAGAEKSAAKGSRSVMHKGNALPAACPDIKTAPSKVGGEVEVCNPPARHPLVVLAIFEGLLCVFA
jgi:hypothetical protein